MTTTTTTTFPNILKKTNKNFVQRQLAADLHQFHDVFLVPNLPEVTILHNNKTERTPYYSKMMLANTFNNDHTRFYDYPLFSNPVAIVAKDDATYHHPKDRCTVKNHFVYTFEFDKTPIDDQLAWFIPPRHSRFNQSVIGKMIEAIKNRFVDFVGFTSCYSGSKSTHTHIIFNTSNIPQNLTPTAIRDGYENHFVKLAEIIKQHISEPFDEQLKTPEQLRRMPGANFDKSRAPQVTIAEDYPSRQPSSATEYFHTPSLYVEKDRFQSRKQSSTTTTSSNIVNAASAAIRLEPEEIAYCENELRKLYPPTGVPIFSHLEVAGFGDWQAKFYNNASDNKPASLMKQDYSTAKFYGTGANEAAAAFKPLEMPLGAMLKLWQKRFKQSRQQAPTQPATQTPDAQQIQPPAPLEYDPEKWFTFDPSSKSKSTKQINPYLASLPIGSKSTIDEIETWFEQNAKSTDSNSTASAIQTVLQILFDRRDKFIWIKSPEGASKSSGIYRLYDEYMQNQRDRKLSMFAFCDYETAEEKCEEFRNNSNTYGHDCAVVNSFSQQYKIITDQLGLQRLSKDDAIKAKANSLWAHIKKQQPQVVDELETYYTHFIDRIENASSANNDITIKWYSFAMFVVHDVAHEWNSKTSLTRAMLTRGFWQTDKTRRHLKSRDYKMTNLALLVHDEIAWENLLDAATKPELEWIDDFRTLYHGKNLESLSERWKAFTAAKYKIPFTFNPDDKGIMQGISFDEFEKYLAIDPDQWLDVTMQRTGYPIRPNQNCEDIYAPKEPVRCLRVNRWWQDSQYDISGRASTTIVLTTELLPTVVADKIGGWSVYQLDPTPFPANSTANEVHVYTRKISSQTANDVIEDFKNDPTITPAIDPNNVYSSISNKSKSSRSHKSARGSNQYMHHDIVQTQLYFPPHQHEMYMMLDSWMGAKNSVSIAHLDIFSQTAGRNKGFRHRGRNHYLIVSKSLWDNLKPMFTAASRYRCVEHVQKRSRTTQIYGQNAQQCSINTNSINNTTSQTSQTSPTSP